MTTPPPLIHPAIPYHPISSILSVRTCRSGGAGGDEWDTGEVTVHQWSQALGGSLHHEAICPAKLSRAHAKMLNKGMKDVASPPILFVPGR